LRGLGGFGFDRDEGVIKEEVRRPGRGSVVDPELKSTGENIWKAGWRELKA